ncbi:MAG: type I-C CRISPR-associated protein Cas8c/Csd1 [Clostridia bacterium]|nr:type I-C CRISPR-associated protein Cas8c/Csd1 [Clostridia bacterium]
MILQSLNRYYDRLVRDGKLERPGWQPVKVSYALQINDEGQLVHVLPRMIEVERGKKKVMVPMAMNLPAQVKRSVGIVSNFLCDNSTYILGLDNKGKPERTVKCFEACRDLHIELLKAVDSAPARAICRFFESWQPQAARDCELLAPFMDDLLGGANITFAYGQSDVENWTEVQQAWDDHYNNTGDGRTMRCLVTGEEGIPARIHPSIRGVAGGQPMGTTLVGFNAPAFESFGRDGGQGLNAPVSERAAFAYSAALNYMIAEQGHHLRLSDATIVFWAESGNDGYAACFAAMFGEDAALTDDDLFDALKGLAAGRNVTWRESDLSPDEHFYVLGLSPNAARLAVRFFLQNTFGDFAKNLAAHHERMRIVKPDFDMRSVLSFRQMLDETVNQKSRDKSPSPLLSGALVRSVLQGLPYPVLLLEQVELRIRAEHRITRGRAAIIKAFLLRNTRGSDKFDQYKEALEVELNENTNYQPYLLGRLFAVLEGLQQAANPGINATIRDRYFNSACATPSIVFPQLIKLAQAHLKKLDGGLAVYYNRQLGDILCRFNADYPTRLSLYDQGIFQLGYYYQVQTRYMKKEEK